MTAAKAIAMSKQCTLGRGCYDASHYSFARACNLQCSAAEPNRSVQLTILAARFTLAALQFNLRSTAPAKLQWHLCHFGQKPV